MHNTRDAHPTSWDSANPPGQRRAQTPIRDLICLYGITYGPGYGTLPAPVGRQKRTLANVATWAKPIFS
jgi:hypothetical protein